MQISHVQWVSFCSALVWGEVTLSGTYGLCLAQCLGAALWQCSGDHEGNESNMSFLHAEHVLQSSEPSPSLPGPLFVLMRVYFAVQKPFNLM